MNMYLLIFPLLFILLGYVFSIGAPPPMPSSEFYGDIRVSAWTRLLHYPRLRWRLTPMQIKKQYTAEKDLFNLFNLKSYVTSCVLLYYIFSLSPPAKTIQAKVYKVTSLSKLMLVKKLCNDCPHLQAERKSPVLATTLLSIAGMILLLVLLICLLAYQGRMRLPCWSRNRGHDFCCRPAIRKMF